MHHCCCMILRGTAISVRNVLRAFVVATNFLVISYHATVGPIRMFLRMFTRQSRNVNLVIRGEICPIRYIIFAERMEGCVSADESRVGTLSRNDMVEIFVFNR